MLDWFNRREVNQIYFSAVGEVELCRGAAILPIGIRRENLLVVAIDAMINDDFAVRVVPFDSAATSVFTEIFAIRRTNRRSIGFADC